MRADRLVSLVLLLQRHGRMSATALAGELEVSTRTVLRDVEALSAAGVPVYAERGRHGGFALLPGYRDRLAALSGLTQDEALALLVAGSRRGAASLGLGPALTAAVLKVVEALPTAHREAATGAADRLLVEPEADLLARREPVDAAPAKAMSAVRRAVAQGRRLRLDYAAVGEEPRWRTVDPVGLVTVRGAAYLLAERDGEDRTYRLSRVRAAEVLDEPAERSERVDLARAWRERSERFRTSGAQVRAVVTLDPQAREELVETALAIHAEEPDADRLRLEVSFQDLRHATWALWRLGTRAEALGPDDLRAALRERATALAERYGR